MATEPEDEATPREPRCPLRTTPAHSEQRWCARGGQWSFAPPGWSHKPSLVDLNGCRLCITRVVQGCQGRRMPRLWQHWTAIRWVKTPLGMPVVGLVLPGPGSDMSEEPVSGCEPVAHAGWVGGGVNYLKSRANPG